VLRPATVDSALASDADLAFCRVIHIE